MVHVDMDSSNAQKYIWKTNDFLDVENSVVKYAVLILNRPISTNHEYLLHLWNKAAIRVTVDGGTNRWYKITQKETCILPDMVTGDMDSIKSEVLAHYESKGVKVVRTPDQNETDFTKALKEVAVYMRQKHIKIDAIIAVVESSGRLDQIIANINTLYKSDLILREIPVFLLGRNSLSWKLNAGCHEISLPILTESSKEWCSLIPIGSSCRVTTTGLKWNLDNRITEFGKMVSTSNSCHGSSVVTVNTTGNLLWSMALNISIDDDDDD